MCVPGLWEGGVEEEGRFPASVSLVILLGTEAGWWKDLMGWWDGCSLEITQGNHDQQHWEVEKVVPLEFG